MQLKVKQHLVQTIDAEVSPFELVQALRKEHIRLRGFAHLDAYIRKDVKVHIMTEEVKYPHAWVWDDHSMGRPFEHVIGPASEEDVAVHNALDVLLATFR